MPQPYLSEIRIFSFNFAPQGWAFCNGQLLPINQNQALFALLGTTYGGDGQTTFALPDLRSRAPVHEGPSFDLGQRGGEEVHQARASADSPTVAPPTNNFWASNTGFTPYGNAADLVMSPACISNVGGSQAHENRSPFLVLNFCIALQGVFPSQT
jgi:microcystin-dependent protein